MACDDSRSLRVNYYESTQKIFSFWGCFFFILSCLSYFASYLLLLVSHRAGALSRGSQISYKQDSSPYPRKKKQVIPSFSLFNVVFDVYFQLLSCKEMAIGTDGGISWTSSNSDWNCLRYLCINTIGKYLDTSILLTMTKIIEHSGLSWGGLILRVINVDCDPSASPRQD